MEWHSIQMKMRFLAYPNLCHCKTIHSPHIQGRWIDIKHLDRLDKRGNTIEKKKLNL